MYKRAGNGKNKFVQPNSFVVSGAFFSWIGKTSNSRARIDVIKAVSTGN